MRFGISATSLMCPKNLRTRLRPVNVCCTIVASHYRRPLPDSSEARLPPPSGLNFDPFQGPGAPSSGARESPRPEFVLPTFKTQNDVRGDLESLRPSEPFHHGLQKPEI